MSPTKAVRRHPGRSREIERRDLPIGNANPCRGWIEQTSNIVHRARDETSCSPLNSRPVVVSREELRATRCLPARKKVGSPSGRPKELADLPEAGLLNIFDSAPGFPRREP